MPFTPFHMGPALAFKAVTGRHFSVLVFGIAQVAMDIEPLVGMLNDREVLHGWTHTWLGATLIGLLVAVAAPPAARVILLQWNDYLARKGTPWLASPPGISRFAAFSGAMLGAWSHVLLDSVMHADMRPLAPWSEANGLLGALPLGELHLFCVGAGVVDMLVWLVAGMLRRDRGAPAGPVAMEPLHLRSIVSSRPAVFFHHQTLQFGAGAAVMLAVVAGATMVQGSARLDGPGDVVAIGFAMILVGLMGGGLFALGTAWGGVPRLPRDYSPFAAGALVTASWIVLRLWMDTLPVEPGIEGAKAQYTRGGLGTLWILAAPALAGMTRAWLARWRHARAAASDDAAR